MNFSLKSDHVMIFLLLVFLAVIIVSVYHQHRLMNSSFNLFDLLMVNGKLSHGHVFSTGGWLLHTWTVAFWTLQGTVKSEDFLVYSGIWITPYLMHLFKGGASSAEPNKCGKPEENSDAK